ncbi:MAG: hypothetical protein N2689_00285, partial [Verrucomicrobiae bacterium]|nr:hypothetical protein [Verrucomicrobiae bacterium]
LGNPGCVSRADNTVRLSPDGGEAGVELFGLYGVPGKNYRATAHINTEGFSGEIEFALMHGDRVLKAGKARVPKIKGRFATASLAAPSAEAPLGIRIIARGNGTVLIGAPSMMPVSTTAGINPAVLPLLKQLSPTWLRWPGGNFAQTYHWRDGVGPRNDRPPRTNMAWPKGPVESNDFGTDEFIAVCRALQAEPVICVNVNGNGATAQEAADWVAYCKRRGFKVKHWELGNEIYGTWEVGHSDAATYARNAMDYIQAMRAADKTIKFIAVGHDLEWNRTVLARLGPFVDYLAQHHYPKYTTYEEIVREPQRYEKFLIQVRELARTASPNRPLRVMVNEWNVSGGDNVQWSLGAALFGARFLHMLARQDGFVDYACSSDLINGWQGGAIQYEKGRAFLTPLGEVLAVYRRRMPGKKVAVECSHPALDVLASRNPSGSQYGLAIINRDRQREFMLTLDFGKWKPGGAEEWCIGGSPDDKRGFNNPTAVPARTGKLTKNLGGYNLTAAPCSVTVVKFQR